MWSQWRADSQREDPLSRNLAATLTTHRPGTSASISRRKQLAAAGSKLYVSNAPASKLSRVIRRDSASRSACTNSVENEHRLSYMIDNRLLSNVRETTEQFKIRLFSFDVSNSIELLTRIVDNIDTYGNCIPGILVPKNKLL